VTRVLLGQSYYLRFDAKLFEAMQPYPPLGSLYAAAVLRERGYDVSFFDAMLAESETAWTRALCDHTPDVAVLFEDNFNYLSKMCLARMRDAAVTMIGTAIARGIPVVVAGADATDHADIYLDAGASYVILGEGELALVDVLELMDRQRPGGPESVAGLAWRDAAGAVRSTDRRPPIRDLDDLPFPAWDLVDFDRYRVMWEAQHGRFSLNMVTTRGCPYHCNWCAKPIWGQRYHARSPENVVAELEHILHLARPDHIWFCDDIMGLKPGWFESFAGALEARNLRVPFKCLSRPDLLLRGNAIEALSRAGAESVWMGAESGAQHILDAMEKGTTIEQIEAATRGLKRAGVRVGLFLQFGYPGETREDIRATFDMVERLQPDDIGVSVSYPLPGTPFHERVRTELGVKQNWNDSNDLAMMYRGPFTTAFYRKLHLILHKEFRSRRTARTIGARVARPWRLRRRDARALAAWAWYRSSLPLDRVQLDRLATVSNGSGAGIAGARSAEAAATPSEQPDGADRPVV
jgi:radical SAM superfamily enzyme YgiQ (UPF0313 family)